VQFVFDDGHAQQELQLHLDRPDACVADLADALNVAGPGVSIDGRVIPGELALSEAGLVTGSRLEPAGQGEPPPPAGAAVLRVVGGLVAGESFQLPPGRTVVGRGGQAQAHIPSAEVSREHCLLDVSPAGTVTLSDLGSRNGTDVNGVRAASQVPVPVGPNDIISLGGGVLLRVLPAMSLPPTLGLDPMRVARPGGVLPFTRAPRPGLPPEEPPLRAPAAPRSAAKPTFSIAAILSPLAMAGAMVVITHSVAYAAIAGLSPIMVIANFVEERTRGKRSVRRGVRAFQAELDQFARRLRARRSAEVARRQAATPDPAEMCFRADGPAGTLWERRPGGPGFMQLTAGFATLPWQVPVQADEQAPEVEREIAAAASLPQVPAAIDLSASAGGGGVVGIHGDREAALAVARSLLCQAVTGTGPADLAVVVCADSDRAASWDWTKWLPHVADRSGGGERLLASGAEQAEALARALLAAAPAPAAARGDAASGPLLLVVVDGAALLEGRPCALRDLLAGRAGPACGIVLTDRLPALCTATLAVRPDGITELRRLTTAEIIPDVLATGVTEPLARRLARRLARFEDPELRVEGAGLPDSVTLLPLLGMPEISGAALLGRWRDGAASLRAGAVIGVTEDGLFGIDLDDDGPHGLVAGTTGSGKSELLRTLIVSLAAGNDPEHLTFALVDYKGGGALDECARLPHAVGLVTDLDEQLSERALRCLEAELRHREHLLRDAGLSHVTDYQRLRDESRRDLEPMPRLAVVIDEFATLVKALPHFVDSLVSIAQRGRSLGIHLIMATQRPAGSVNDAIKNNVKLRIALRLESPGDSMDVIDSPAAASIGGRQRGRAFYRVSAREVLPVQTALSTGVTAARESAAPLSLAPFVFGASSAAGDGPAHDGPTDLQRLVSAACEAVQAGGFSPPRRPWPDPLPGEISLDALPEIADLGLQTATPGLPVLGLADDPDRQAQYPVGWDPGAGNLLLFGAAGYGTTSALATLALSVARAYPPDAWHIFVMDLGAGGLAPLAGLPHTGAYIGSAERERQTRLIRLLRNELDRRKSGGSAPASGPAGAVRGGRRPEWLILIDNFAAFLADYTKDAAGTRLTEDLQRVYADGPTVGIRFAVTADRAGAVPGPWAALTQQKLLFRLADPGDYGNFDVPRNAVPSPVPGRAVVAATRQVIQVAWPGADLADAVTQASSRWPGARREAPAVGLLPTGVRMSELGVAARLPGPAPAGPASGGPASGAPSRGAVAPSEPAWIPAGIGDGSLAPVGLELYEHEHALIAGPPRSGRSSVLCAIAQALAASAAPPAMLALVPRRSPLRDSSYVRRVVTSCAELGTAVQEHPGGALCILADDADSVDDPAGLLERLMKPPNAHVTVIAAGRSDTLRRSFGHWTQKVRESRCGVLLIPDYDLDGDLLGVTLPRLNRLAAIPGRGFLCVGGSVEGIQVAMPG
jgi:S-DNA-T family DNA segregation ATPase FtsK/SpoIIIE